MCIHVYTHLQYSLGEKKQDIKSNKLIMVSTGCMRLLLEKQGVLYYSKCIFINRKPML